MWMHYQSKMSMCIEVWTFRDNNHGVGFTWVFSAAERLATRQAALTKICVLLGRDFSTEVKTPPEYISSCMIKESQVTITSNKSNPRVTWLRTETSTFTYYYWALTWTILCRCQSLPHDMLARIRKLTSTTYKNNMSKHHWWVWLLERFYNEGKKGSTTA